MSRASSFVEADLKFLEWQDVYEKEKPYEIYVDMPDGHDLEVEQNNLVFQTVRTKVTNVRGFEHEFKLEQHGFEFCSFKTKLTDAHLDDRQMVERIYMPEVEELLRNKYPTASRLFVFDWRIRKHQPAGHKQLDLNNRNTYLRPATEVHLGESIAAFRPPRIEQMIYNRSETDYEVDQSPRSVVRRIQLQLASEASTLLRLRVRVVNVWRPLIDSIQDWPLALCDATTVDPKDLIECDNIRKHYTGSTMYVLHNPDMQWYFLGDQGKDTATILKIFDSSTTTPCRGVPHSGFQLPVIPENAEPRRSIEVRVLVFTPN